MVPVEVKSKAYDAFIYSSLIYGILSWGKSSYGNKVTLERIIKRAWRVILYGSLYICKSLLNYESMFSYFIGVKFYKIMRIDCHSYLLRKIKIQDKSHEHHT